MVDRAVIAASVQCSCESGVGHHFRAIDGHKSKTSRGTVPTLGSACSSRIGPVRRVDLNWRGSRGLPNGQRSRSAGNARIVGPAHERGTRRVGSELILDRSRDPRAGGWILGYRECHSREVPLLSCADCGAGHVQGRGAISLPTRPDDGCPLRHEETVTRARSRHNTSCRSRNHRFGTVKQVGTSRICQGGKRRRAGAVMNFIEQRPIGLCRIGRRQNDDVEFVSYDAACIARVLQVNDRRGTGIFGRDLAGGFGQNVGVSTHGSEGGAIEGDSFATSDHRVN